jgi:hypothetical protein
VKKLVQAGITAPLLSTYVVELPMARDVVGNALYSFPANITDGKGGTYGLAKESLEFIEPIASSCNNNYTCMKKKIDESGKFDASGTSNRQITLKQIMGGVPMLYTK